MILSQRAKVVHRCSSALGRVDRSTAVTMPEMQSR
jgi:hypothetical protein